MKDGFDQVEIENFHKDGTITTHYLDPGEQLEIKVTGQ